MGTIKDKTLKQFIKAPELAFKRKILVSDQIRLKSEVKSLGQKISEINKDIEGILLINKVKFKL